jgi:hypothetical protein
MIGIHNRKSAYQGEYTQTPSKKASTGTGNRPLDSGFTTKLEKKLVELLSVYYLK